MVRKVLFSIGAILITLFLMILFSIITVFIMNSKVPVTIIGSNVYTESWDNGSVFAEGTWEDVFERYNQKDNVFDTKLQISKIECRRDLNLCNEANALVSGSVLMADLKYFDIERWDDKFIIYSHRLMCISNVYTISRDTKQVSVVTSLNKNAESISNCKGLEGTKDDIKRLVDGYSIYQEMINEARPIWLIILGFIFSLGFLGISLIKIWKKSNNAVL